MMRPFAALAVLVLAALPSLAEEGHDHLAEAAGIRVLHAWTPATDGPDALIYMEIANTGDRSVTLTGGAVEGGGALMLVGFVYQDAVESWVDLPGIVVRAGDELDLAPKALALRAEGIGPLAEGAEVGIEVAFGDAVLDVHVAVEAADATAHSHAGHSH